MRNFFIGVLVIAFIAYIVYAIVHKKTVDSDSIEAVQQKISIEAGQQEPITKSNTQKNGMNIEVTKEGNGPEITNGQTAVVDYVGKLSDGTIFDASARYGKPFEFALGAGMVIKGWEQGVVGMKVGETRTLTIPPELAYGSNGISGVIPPNATLIFEVTLKGIK